ncbi:exported hypothetical protein [Candidatus Contendobacter odensis Run_B_J11]|uniref:Uncharacterized protein n=1 Tax=Candidatus Contendobacter odensis Run_B_J11 TaxID=1400861 RepID=A0A7U7G9F9_9GAMM|nr:exported hypothetical protein [Candidatus Contendobacter odensis Run_B_J11]
MLLMVSCCLLILILALKLIAINFCLSGEDRGGKRIGRMQGRGITQLVQAKRGKLGTLLQARFAR